MSLLETLFALVVVTGVVGLLALLATMHAHINREAEKWADKYRWPDPPTHDDKNTQISDVNKQLEKAFGSSETRKIDWNGHEP